MRQLIVPYSEPVSSIIITKSDFHYLIHVLRLRNGDTFPVLLQNGSQYTATIKNTFEDRCICTLQEETKENQAVGSPELPKIVLIQAIPKGKKMDQIVRQATECGVSTIVPVLTRFSQTKLGPEDIPKKQQRWRKIIKEAVQQSGSPIITTIEKPIPLTEISAFFKSADSGLLFYESPLETKSLHQYLSDYQNDKLFLCIGAEGGFSKDEVQYLHQLGFFPIYLGNSILRVETAVVYTIGAVKTYLQENR